ncbi:MAG: ThuA domain-containing protein [Vicinamibacterales bacterium]
MIGSVLVCAAVLQVPSAAKKPSRVLLMTYNTFYNHSNLLAIEDVLPELGKAGGFTVTSVQGYEQTVSCTTQKPCGPDVVDLSIVTRAYLKQFDAIVASTNGELPFSDEAKQALVDFVKKDGKGMLFLHQSYVTNYGWKEWGELLGAYMGNGQLFDGTNTAKRKAVMKVENRKHPASRALPEHWTLDDEFYQYAKTTGVLGPTKLPVPFAFDRTKVNVLVSFDTERTDFTGAPKEWSKDGDYPQVWSQKLGKGRTFYSAIGHREDLWRSDPVFRQFMTGAIRWVLGLEK